MYHTTARPSYSEQKEGMLARVTEADVIGSRTMSGDEAGRGGLGLC